MERSEKMKRIITIGCVAVISLCVSAEPVKLEANNKARFYNGDKLKCENGEFTIMPWKEEQVRGGYFYLDSIPVDTTKKYRLSGEFKLIPGSQANQIRFGIVPSSAQKRQIEARSIFINPGSETELASDCKADDTSITLKDMGNWKGENISLVAFNVKSDQSDLPNNNITPTIKSIVKKDGVFEVSLTGKCGKNYPAGTMVREHFAGYSYFYAGGVAVPLTADWKKTEAIIPAGEVAEASIKRWWVGTKYASVIIESKSTDAGIMFRNVKLEEIEEQGLQ